MTYCTSCGKELPESGEFCPNCGTSIRYAVSSNETAAERILSESSLQEHWVKRLIAIVVDSIIVGVATAITGFFINVAGIFNWLSFPFAMGLVYVLYFTITELTYGYTIGKKIVKLKVVTADGKRPSLEGAFIRNISKIHFIFLLLDTIGGFFLSKDPHQKYIDQIAHTTVQ
ncbi:MAG: RDD family protein [Candidatus Bathyarchaeota archaeon]|nr:RDD family protein [Candidatus Bathyarchaeota archaeon]